MDEQYAYTPETLDRLAATAVPVWEVDYVLRHSRPCIRQHVGAVLRIIGRDRTDAWLAVALIETSDDHYEVVGARYLDDVEARAAIDILGEQP